MSGSDGSFPSIEALFYFGPEVLDELAAAGAGQVARVDKQPLLLGHQLVLIDEQHFGPRGGQLADGLVLSRDSGDHIFEVAPHFGLADESVVTVVVGQTMLRKSLARVVGGYIARKGR